MTAHLVENINFSEFIGKNLEAQRKILAQIRVSDLKKPSELMLLKKFIILNVLMEARQMAENRGRFNITASFREFLNSYVDLDLKIKSHPSIIGKERLRSGFEDPSFLEQKGLTIPDEIEGYGIRHVSDMGRFFRTTKYFELGVIEQNNSLALVKSKHIEGFGFQHKSSTEHYEQLINKKVLTALFAEIKKEASYENPFGYDLLCLATACANLLLELAICNYPWKIIGVPLALVLNLIVYALVIPPALIAIAVETIIISPLAWIIDKVSPDEHAEFIESVTSPSI